MKLFTDLKVNQAVKVGEVFVVSLPSGHYVNPNGERFTLADFDNHFSVDSVSGWKKVIKTPARVVEFVFEDGSRVSVEEYVKLTQEEASYYDDDYEGYIYPDLETEFEIKKQLEAFNRAEKIYSEPVESFEDITFNVVGAVKKSGSEFITSPIQYGQVTWNNSTGIWKVDCGKIAKDAYNKATQDVKNKEIPTHSNINYAQVNGKYAFTNDEKNFDWIKNPNSTFITDSLEKAYEKEEFIRKHVASRIYLHTNPTKITEQTALEIWEALKGIQSYVSRIDPKQKSVGNKRSAVKSINDLMTKLEDI